MERQRIAKTTLKKENKVGGISLPNFKTYIQLQQPRLHGIGGRTYRTMKEDGEPRNMPHKYALLIFNKGAKKHFNGVKTGGAGIIEHPYAKH